VFTGKPDLTLYITHGEAVFEVIILSICAA